MGVLRFLFAPELGRPVADAARDAAVLLRRVGKPWHAVSPIQERRAPPSPKRRCLRPSGLLLPVLGLGLAGIGLIGIILAGLIAAYPAAAQTIDPGLFADADRATRNVLAFLGDIGGLDAGRSSALGAMLFAFNAGVLLLAGFLLVWHMVAGTVDTAREGRFGFGAWAIVRIVVAVALMAPLPGGMNGAQHAVVGLAHLGGDFANAVWKPFSEEALGPKPAHRAAAPRSALARRHRPDPDA